MYAITDSGIVLVVTSITTGAVAIIGAIFAGLAMLRAGKINAKVDTVETRRIEHIDPAYRTAQEDRHLAEDAVKHGD